MPTEVTYILAQPTARLPPSESNDKWSFRQVSQVLRILKLVYNGTEGGSAEFIGLRTA